jgi:hypothetical protein
MDSPSVSSQSMVRCLGLSSGPKRATGSSSQSTITSKLKVFFFFLKLSFPYNFFKNFKILKF